MASQTILIFITLFSFLSISTPTPTRNILNDAVTVLSDSGYNSMSLTLEFGSRSIITPPTTSSLTIFSPSDDVFSKSGQPSLNLLQFHFSPLYLSLHSLKSLSPGSKVPSFWANHSLVITSDGNEIEVNGVKLNRSPVYDNGSLVIFGISKFLDPNFQSLDCPVRDRSDDYSFEEASRFLQSYRYFDMASFLDLQLAGFKDQMLLTIFAPNDESLKGYLGYFSEYKSIFLRHFVPCQISMVDLASVQSDGLLMHTYLDGFSVNVTTDGNSVMVNGVEVIAPELYINSWLIVHGLNGSLLHKGPHSSSSDNRSNCADSVADFVSFASFAILFLLCIASDSSFIGWFALFFLILVSLC